MHLLTYKLALKAFYLLRMKTLQKIKIAEPQEI